MDPLDAPPPAYSAEEFDQKMSRATKLSLETPGVEIDEDGFPRYDPAMFGEPSKAQKGKDQLFTSTTFRSSSISKRPLPNPKSSTSSTDAGPSTLRQTRPLHISKKSISKAEEAGQDTIAVSTHSTKDTSEDIPPYAAQNHLVSDSISQSIPTQSINDTPGDNPPYTVLDPHVSTSVPIQSIDDTPEDNPPYTAMDPHVSTIQSITPEDNPPYERNYPTDLPYAEQPQRGNWEEGGHVVSEPFLDERPQSAELERPEHFGQGHEALNSHIVTTANQMVDRYSMAPDALFHRGPQNPNTAPMSNQMRNSQSQYSTAPNPIHRGPQNPNSAPMSNQMRNSQSQYSNTPNPIHRGPQNPNSAISNQMRDSQSMAPNPPFHRGPQNPNVVMSNQMRDSQSQHSMALKPLFHHGPQNPNVAVSNQMLESQSHSMDLNPPFHRVLDPNTANMSSQMRESQSQYSMAPNPPVFRGPQQQHFSLPPAPRILPRMHPSDRPRSQSTSPSSTSSQPATTPRVLFNHNVAYGKSSTGGQFLPKVHTSQTSFQAPYDPATFYNSAVSSHLSTSMKTPDQAPRLPAQRGQVWPNQAVNQPRQWGWHPPGRPSNAYHSVADGGGGTDVSRYSQYPVTNNGYFSQ